LLLLARAAGAWWDRLVRQQGLEDAYTVVDLDRYPVPPADRAEHFRRGGTAFASYGSPGARPAVPPPASELDDPAYAEPLLIHIAALLRTVDIAATPAAGAGQGRAPGKDRPMLGTFLNDPLDVLAEVAGYVAGELGFARCCSPAWEVDREPGTV
jgi:hypothetical protein